MAAIAGMGGPLFANIKYWSSDQAHTLWSFGADASAMGSSGGLKGKMAPGDAHPYLALFCCP